MSERGSERACLSVVARLVALRHFPGRTGRAPRIRSGAGSRATRLAQPSNEELIKKLLAMEQRVQALEKQLKQKQSASAAPSPKAVGSTPDATPPAVPAGSATPADKTQVGIAKWAATAPVLPPGVTVAAAPAAQAPLLP